MTGHNSKTYECRTPDHGLGRRRPRNRRALRSSHWPKCVSSLQKLSLLSHFVSGMTYFWLTRKKTHVYVTLSGSGIYNATLHPRSYSQLAAELPMVWLHNNIFELWVCIQLKVFFLWIFHRLIFLLENEDGREAPRCEIGEKIPASARGNRESVYLNKSRPLFCFLGVPFPLSNF